jgi:hypothetical protein
MPRPLSENARKVLRRLGKVVGCSVDELSARTGVRKDKLARVLWDLKGAGWIAASCEVKELVVYRRLREMPPARRAKRGRKSASHIEVLQAAFGMRLPAKRARGRIVRRSE